MQRGVQTTSDDQRPLQPMLGFEGQDEQHERRARRRSDDCCECAVAPGGEVEERATGGGTSPGGGAILAQSPCERCNRWRRHPCAGRHSYRIQPCS